MSYCWKLKTIALGSPGTGKTSFLKHETFFKEESSAVTLGVSFEAIDCKIKEKISKSGKEELCHATIWDVKPKNRFLFVLPNLLKGSAGCLLFFNLADRKSFEDLKTWMDFIRVVRGNVPVVLVGTKSDLPHQVEQQEIEDFINENQVISYFASSIQKEDVRELAIKDLVSQIIELRKRRYSLEDDVEFLSTHYNIPEIESSMKKIMGGGTIVLKSEFHSLSREDKEEYQDFIDFYSFCPICHKKNHYSSLKNFYFNTDENAIRLKEKLLEIMKEYYKFESYNQEDLTVGIPCCDCYKTIFEEK